MLISKTSDSEKINESTQLNKIIDETDPNSQTISTNSTDTTKTNKILTNNVDNHQVVNVLASKVRYIH